jgi:CYTH domain-containing protein
MSIVAARRERSVAREIERKFLVTGEAWRAGAAAPGVAYRQGYLSAGSDAGCTVRVRIGGERAFLTVKGPAAGAARDEYEYPIPPADAAEMLERLCAGGAVEKVRHRVPFGGRTWEVDVFAGENAPLVVAEVELESAGAEVALPPWVGREVTEDPRYTNAALARAPYSRWGRP